jgi:hypothetical protein
MRSTSSCTVRCENRGLLPLLMTCVNEPAPMLARACSHVATRITSWPMARTAAMIAWHEVPSSASPCAQLRSVRSSSKQLLSRTRTVMARSVCSFFYIYIYIHTRAARLPSEPQAQRGRDRLTELSAMPPGPNELPLQGVGSRGFAQRGRDRLTRLSAMPPRTERTPAAGW